MAVRHFDRYRPLVVPVPDGDADPNPGDGTDFGRQLLSAGTHWNTFGITNTGTDLLSIPISSLDVDVDGFTFSYSSDDLTTIKIQPGEQFQFKIGFNPSVEGRRDGQFSFGTDAPFPRNFYSFALHGNGVIEGKPRAVVYGGSPRRALSSDAVAAPSAATGTIFPDTFPRDSSQRTFVIFNEGDGDLTFPQAPDVGAPFATADSATFDLTTPLAPGQSRAFTVSYMPTSPAPFSNATVRVSSNDPDTQNYFFRVNGSSTAPTELPTLEVTGDTNFGTVNEFTPSPPQIFTITNTGNDELFIEEISIPFADAFVTPEIMLTKIPAGEQIEFPVWLNSEHLVGGRRYTTTVTVRVSEPKFAPVLVDLVATVIELPAPPTILSVDIDGDELVLGIELGEGTYRVERSSDLEAWETVPDLTGLMLTELRLQRSAPDLLFRLVADP